MKKYISAILWGTSLPFLWLTLKYNQNHGYFCEAYSILGLAFVIFLLVHVFLTLLRVPYFVTWLMWIALFLPSGNFHLWADITYRILLVMIVSCILRKKSLRGLRLIFVILLTMNVLQIIVHDFKARQTAKKEFNDIQIPEKLVCHENIYYIICDAYIGQKGLQNYYQFNNSDFYKQLQTLSFQVSDGRVSYYPTLKAMNSYLNLENVDVETMEPLVLHYTLKDNVFTKILKTNGYQTYMYEPRFPFLHRLNHFSSLNSGYITQKLLHLIYIAFHANRWIAPKLSFWLNQDLYERQKVFFESFPKFLEESPNSQKRFFYIHLDLPHAPFILDHNCNFQNDQQSVFWGENEVGVHAYTQENYTTSYVAQIQGLNRFLLPLLKAIISKDPTATIILQGDHGTFATNNSNEHQSILFAIRSQQNYTIQPIETLLKRIIYGK